MDPLSWPESLRSIRGPCGAGPRSGPCAFTALLSRGAAMPRVLGAAVQRGSGVTSARGGGDGMKGKPERAASHGGRASGSSLVAVCRPGP